MQVQRGTELLSNSTPAVQAEPDALPFAHVVSVEGGQAIAAFDERAKLGVTQVNRVVIGAAVAIQTPTSSVIGVVTGLSVPTAALDGEECVLRLVELDLVGEVVEDCEDHRSKPLTPADREVSRACQLVPS